jgi:hypothetical protein
MIPNATLAYEVLDKIDANPENWKQKRWFVRAEPECGTAMCFAGWACHLSGDEPDWATAAPTHDGEMAFNVLTENATIGVGDRAASLLGLTRWQTADLFHWLNTRERLAELVADIFGPDPRGGA